MTGMSKPILKTYGCSFTWGLVREPQDYVGITGERNRCKTWGDYIAEHLDLEHKNLGGNGNGSKQIAWSVQNSHLRAGDIAIIAWSGPLRPFHWCTDKNRYETLTAPDDLPWQQILFEHENAISATANWLRGQNVNYLMTSALMDYKQMDILPDYTKEDWLSWNWIEWDMYNNSLFDICTHSWLTARSQKYSIKDRNLEQHHILDMYPGLAEDNDLLADCFHPSQAGHEQIAMTLLPYVKKFV